MTSNYFHLSYYKSHILFHTVKFYRQQDDVPRADILIARMVSRYLNKS